MRGDLRSPLQMVRDGAAEQPDLDILTFVDVAADGTVWHEVRTYRDILRNGRAVGAALLAEGMRAGDTFALIMRNHPEFVDAMIGSEIAATVFVPIDPRTRGDRLAYMLRFGGCRGAIVGPEVASAVLAVVGQLPDFEWLWVVGESGGGGGIRRRTMADVLARSADALPLPAADLGRPMQILYTSGTTGDPKAILSSYGRFAGIAALGEAVGLRDGDRPYTGLSLTHANAQLMTLGNALAHGLCAVVSRWFTKSRLWDIVRQYECTTFNLLGGMAVAIYAEPVKPAERQHKIRFVLSAGMPANLWEPFASRFGVEIFEFFGAAEGGLTLNPPGGRAGSIGKAPPGTICRILDADDHECPPGVLGELCFRPVDGDAAPVVYLGDPDASAAKVRGGWFRSGDAGSKDTDGWVYFAHRMTNAIRRNGEFVSASRIEVAIAAIDGVADVCVYGVSTAANAPGEKEVVAAVVRAGVARPDPVAIFARCRAEIGSNGVPTFLQFVREIPKTASEKPQERFLAAMLDDENAELVDGDGRQIEAPHLTEAKT